MTRRGLAVAVAALVVTLLTGVAPLQRDALAALDLGPARATPFALVRPLWYDDHTASTAGTSGAARALGIIHREQRSGVLRAVLGAQTARVIQVGDLRAAGQRIGATVLLALPVARHDVRATVPAENLATAASGRVRNVTFTARTLRDVLVDVDLRHDAIAAVQPGPASQTSAWHGPWVSSSVGATAASHRAATLVRLSPGGPRFASYDGSPTLGQTGRDWPVSLVFAGHATIGKVKRGLRAAGFTGTGLSHSLAYAQPGGTVAYDSDRGVKTRCDANGTDVHLRLYAPPATDHFRDPRFGDFVVATVHLDHGDGCGHAPALYGFSEEAEHRVADAVAARLGWRVQPDRLPLGNAEPYRRDLAAPDHLWWSNGRATLINVP